MPSRHIIVKAMAAAMLGANARFMAVCYRERIAVMYSGRRHRTRRSEVFKGFVMKNIATLVVVLTALFLTGNVGLAHHGQAAYSNSEAVTVKGSVTDFQFLNPHCIVTLEVKTEKGETETWQGELTSPNHLIRAGWNARSLKPGDQVTLTGWRAKSGANSLWITRTIVNGVELKTAAGT